MTEERWLPVVGWEGFYQVSDHGRVRTVSRKVSTGRGWRIVPQTVRRPGPTRCGYLNITMSRPGRVSTRTIHTVVLEAFVGPRPLGMEACHRDGDKANNTLSNLRWDTHRANIEDAVRIGNLYGPARTHCSYGHELIPENAYRTKQRPNSKHCKQCLSRYNATARAKRKKTA